MTEKRKTILDAVVEVLRATPEPLSAAEIHQRIVAGEIYAFAAKDAIGVVRSSIQKHLRAVSGSPSEAPRVRREGRDTYSLVRGRAERG